MLAAFAKLPRFDRDPVLALGSNRLTSGRFCRRQIDQTGLLANAFAARFDVVFFTGSAWNRHTTRHK